MINHPDASPEPMNRRSIHTNNAAFYHSMSSQTSAKISICDKTTSNNTCSRTCWRGSLWAKDIPQLEKQKVLTQHILHLTHVHKNSDALLSFKPCSSSTESLEHQLHQTENDRRYTPNTFPPNHGFSLILICNSQTPYAATRFFFLNSCVVHFPIYDLF